MGRHRIAALGMAAVALVFIAGRDGAVSAPRSAAPKGSAARTQPAPSAELSSQRRPRRAPVRINVYPGTVGRPGFSGRPAYFLDFYPRPYPYDWPGPNAKRECVGWLAQEARVSGTVIVPR